MNYTLDINDRPWKAIKNGTKTIEVRTNTKYEDFDYRLIKKGDILTFENNESSELMDVRVLRVTHYKTIKELLGVEGTEKTLSSGKDLKGGVKSINSLLGYKEGVKKNGVFALEIKTI